MRAETQIYLAKSRALLALLQVTDKEHQRFLFTRVEFNPDGSPAGDATVFEAPYPSGLLAKGEDFADATVAQGSGALYAAITTSKGRVLFVEPGQAPQYIVSIPLDTIGQAGLYPVSGGLYLVYPTDTLGMQLQMIKEPLVFP